MAEVGLVGREQRLWVALASIAAFTLGGIVLSTQGSPAQWAGFAAIITALPFGIRVTRRLDRVRKGRLGERLVTELLRRLPDEYYLVNDVCFPAHAGMSITLSSAHVVVIETKRFAGRIRCYGDEWSVNGHARGSVSRQVNSGATALRYFLTERCPDIAPRWVESIVVFTHPVCRLEVNHARSIVARYSELLQLILALAEKHRMAPAVAARLSESIFSLARETGGRRGSVALAR